MPRKAMEFTNNINIRISDEQKRRWNDYIKKNTEFASISHFVRWCVDEIVSGSGRRRDKDENDNIQRRIQENEERIEELLKEQREILKLIAEKAREEKIEVDMNDELRKYQQAIILNLLREKPRDEVELTEITEIPEIEVMQFLNFLLERGLIKQDKNRFKVS